MSEDDDDGIFFSMKLTAEQWSNAQRRDDSGPVVMLIGPENVYITDLTELAGCRGNGSPTVGQATKIGNKDARGMVTVEWRLFTDDQSVWEKESRGFVIDDDQLQAKLIQHLLDLHRHLRDEQGSADGMALQRWGEVFEQLNPGE